MGIFIYFVCFVYRVKCEDYSSPRNPSKIKKHKTYKTQRHEQCKLLKQKKKRERTSEKRIEGKQICMQKTENARVWLYFTGEHDISWIMLKVRGCLFSRAILTPLVQGQYVVMARQRQQPLFYFSFSSIYSDPTEQMYLTFFFTLICYSTISLLELSFYSSFCIFVSISNNFCDVFHIHIHDSLCIFFYFTKSRNAGNAICMAAKKNG